MASSAKVASNLCTESQSTFLRASLVLLTLSLGGAIFLVKTDVEPWLRLVLLVPFYLTFSTMYQAFTKT
jgi:hypothetical protein